MFDSVQSEKSRKETMNGRKIFAVVVSILISLVVIQGVQAADRNFTKTQLEGYSNEKGGTYWPPTAAGVYGCILPDGTVIVCGGALPGCDTITPLVGRPPRRLPEAPPPLILEENIIAKLQNLSSQIRALSSGVNALPTELYVCSAPDLVPLPLPGITGPTAYCRRDPQDTTKLQVLVYNQGAAETDLSGTVTRVVFTTSSGSVQYPSPDASNASPLSSGGSQLVEFDIPVDCTSTTGNSCDFTITVDATNAVGESNELNNTVAGSCGIFLE